MFFELMMDKEFLLNDVFGMFAISGIMIFMFIFILLVRWYNSRDMLAYNKKMARMHLDNARRLCEITDPEPELKKMYVFLYDWYPYLLRTYCVTLSDIGSSEDEIYRIRLKGRESWAREPLVNAYKKYVRSNLTI